MAELKGHLSPKLSTADPRSLSEEELKALEADLGYVLPSDYREFLRDYGGFAVWAQYPIHTPLRPSLRTGVIRAFYGIFPDTQLDVRENRDSLLISGVLLPQLLPIAEQAAGNQVCISLAPEDYGVLYYWDWDGAKEPADRSNLYVIANNFEEFINSLDLWCD